MKELPDTKWRRKLRRNLLAWFDRNARDLPWRRTHDPYQVWVSEIMLQQTQVVTVIPYFERFIKKFPNVRSLAASAEQDVLRLWEGLGYYRRARQLHRAAGVIAREHNGKFPQEFDDVLNLPGIGRYTAGAITSIAFDLRQPILEANSLRVFSRLWGFEDDPQTSLGQRQLWSFAEAVLPRRRVGDFNQAVMELGSELCTPIAPGCDRCPARNACVAFLQNKQDQIPLAKRRMTYEDVHEVAIVIWRKDKVLLRQCQEGERWAGLWDFPRFAANGSNTRGFTAKVKSLTGIGIRMRKQRTTIKHGVTRFRITLDCYDAGYRTGEISDRGVVRWVAARQLTKFPLSVTGRRIAKLLS